MCAGGIFLVRRHLEAEMPNIAIRGESLFVKTMGAGPPVVLMHGGPGLDHTTLLGLAPLARYYQLIFYDHRSERSE